MSRTVIYTINEKEFQKAMEILDILGYTWADGESCTSGWRPNNGADRLIYLSLYSVDKSITFSTIKPEEEEEEYEYDDIISLEEFMKQHPLSFTKANLKDGMVVQTNENLYYIYFEKMKKFVGEDGFLCINSYNDDLTHKDCYLFNDDTFDIKAVFVIKDLCSLSLFSAAKANSLEKIWERPEKIYMTISEIEEKLGIKNLEIVEK